MFKKIKNLLVHKPLEKEIKELKEKGDMIDEHLNKVVRRATLNHDDGWFMTMIKRKEPECVIKVLQECEDANERT